MRYFSIRYIIPTALLISVLAGINNHLSPFLQLSRLFSYYFFYLFGIWLNRINILRLSSSIKINIIAFCCFVFVLSIHYLLSRRIEILTWSTSFSQATGISFFSFKTRIYSITVTILLSVLAILAVPNRNYWITKWGRFTLSPYLLHFILIGAVCWGFMFDYRFHILGYFINLFLVPLACMLMLSPPISDALNYLLNRWNPWPRKVSKSSIHYNIDDDKRL